MQSKTFIERMEHMMYTPVTLPVTNEYGYFEIRLESIGGLGGITGGADPSKYNINIDFIFPLFLVFLTFFSF